VNHNNPLERLHDRARGVVLGQACGDALGAQVEFKPRGTFKTPRDMKDGGPHRLKAGMWTDDTAMAVHLAEWLLEANWLADRGLPPAKDLMDRWVSWMRDGVHSPTGTCFDIGGRTAYALNHWERTRQVTTSSRPFPDGNGAVMRVSPVAVYYWAMPNERAIIAEWQARLTHGRLAAKSAVAIADAIACLFANGTRDQAIGVANGILHEHWMDPRYLERDQVMSEGHTLDTTEAALWCLATAKSAEDCILRAVELGHDADTTAAVAGALAGAYWGASALPQRWVSRVYWREELEALADALVA
jgi:ADP-ribosylglycohydrolase